MDDMLNLPSVTLICIDCIHHTAAINAINKSIDKINFGNVLFLTDKPQRGVEFEQILIDTITSKQQYSSFIINNLVDYIHTDYVLIIQYDGYVINPQLWSDKFLEFDYIGAAWWYNDQYSVGNGGFSLRSKRFLNVISMYELPSHPEDEVICRDYGEYFKQKHGIKYADEATASIFSYERNQKYTVFNNNTFGFHGIRNLIIW